MIVFELRQTPLAPGGGRGSYAGISASIGGAAANLAEHCIKWGELTADVQPRRTLQRGARGNVLAVMRGIVTDPSVGCGRARMRSWLF